MSETELEEIPITSVVEHELQTIYNEHGELLPETVLEAARPASSPLHAYFEWDDARAAHEHRLDQARRLIRSVKVVYAMDTDGRNKKVRRYHSVPGSENRPVYKDLDEIVHNPLHRQMLLRQMERDWRSFKSRYEHLDEYVALIAAEAKAS